MCHQPVYISFLDDSAVHHSSGKVLRLTFVIISFRAAIVQNQHLAVLAEKLRLDQFMLYAHGSDLCHDSELRHAMANCFEALMGAIFLDSGIEVTGNPQGFIVIIDCVRAEALIAYTDYLDRLI